MTAALSLRGVRVEYGETAALAGVDLEVGASDLLAVLGPSGSGKTTLLSVVAGFLRPSGGAVEVDGRVVAGPGVDLPPERRNVGVVFQNYALWPHLTALETVAYPYLRRGVARREAEKRAAGLLAALGIRDLAGRLPSELSGGQQQRVGLARALAREARLYLLDEPTAHLDAPLRAALQDELDAQRRRLGAAAVYATHDAGEALAVADAVAILRAGRVIQLGTPRQVYEEPVDLWAARLTGPASLLPAAVAAATGLVEVAIDGTTVSVPGAGPGNLAVVRPDWTHLGGPFGGRVEQVRYRGSHTDYLLSTGGPSVEVRRPGPPAARRGEAVTWGLDRVWLTADQPSTAAGPG